MPDATSTPELVVDGFNYRAFAVSVSEGVEYSLEAGQRPFGPDYTPVDVLEVRGGGAVWGFLVDQGFPGKSTWSAVSELIGDHRWNYVIETFDANEGGAMDVAARAVVADVLVRGEIKRRIG
jgi:hypothetical protein